MVRSQLQERRVPGSKPNPTQTPLCCGYQIGIAGHTPSHSRGIGLERRVPAQAPPEPMDKMALIVLVI
ncbi:hypothetical protein AVEN_26014-1 [Araneus ventricosus]|uniref:Uncharacterized protein n=1 Tax=Araneus ventricosus TaxID=182803 RepID=A0A4Y2E2G1_ARAVE|nr:hypothetical protein AVEN_26014-1 [Araneus ventricosus]